MHSSDLALGLSSLHKPFDFDQKPYLIRSRRIRNLFRPNTQRWVLRFPYLVRAIVANALLVYHQLGTTRTSAHMRNDQDPLPAESDIQAQLGARFGVTMSTEEVAQTLKMSVSAFRMAKSRKQVPLEAIPMNGRRHQIYWTSQVVRFLLSQTALGRENAM